MLKLTDDQLRDYIQQVFARYDRDRSGNLDCHEIAPFFNDLFTITGNPERINAYQAKQALMAADMDGDNRANKEELLIAYKMLISEQAYGQHAHGQTGYYGVLGHSTAKLEEGEFNSMIETIKQYPTRSKWT